MRWVTYQDGDGDRVGVLNDELIHALAPGASRIELIGHGADRLAEAGQRALRTPAEVVALHEVTLRAPVPRPPAIRDCLCFLEHQRNGYEATGRSRVLADVFYRIPV